MSNRKMSAAMTAGLMLFAGLAFGEETVESSCSVMADFDTRPDSPRVVTDVDAILPFALADEGTITVAEDGHPERTAALANRGDGTAVWTPRYRATFTATHSSGLTATFVLTITTGLPEWDVDRGVVVDSASADADFDTRPDSPRVITDASDILPFALADEGTIVVAEDQHPSVAVTLADRGDGTAVWTPHYRATYTATHSSGLTAYFNLSATEALPEGDFAGGVVVSSSASSEGVDLDLREGEERIYEHYADAVADLAYSNASDWRSGGDPSGASATVRLTPMYKSSATADWTPAGSATDLIVKAGEGTVVWKPTGAFDCYKVELLVGGAGQTSLLVFASHPFPQDKPQDVKEMAIGQTFTPTDGSEPFSWKDDSDGAGKMILYNAQSGKFVVTEGKPANATAANPFTSFESYVLGLDPTKETSKPFLQGRQTTEPDKVAFSLGGIAPKAIPGVTVRCVIESSASLASEWSDGGQAQTTIPADGTTTIKADLPTTGERVRYYRPKFTFHYNNE